MKVKVLKKFIDKNTKKLHKVGEELSISKKRYDEIMDVAKDLIEEVKETKEAAKKAAE